MTIQLTKHELVITRTFDAPREQVWKAWTEPWRLMRWWGPKVFSTPVYKNDLRVGGEYLACMRAPDGKDYWSKGEYIEIEAPAHLVVTDSFSDEHGNSVPPSHYDMKGDTPVELFVTVTLDEDDGKTKFTLHHIGVEVFDAENQKNMAQGWNEMLDKLEAFLKSAALTKIVAEPGTRDITVSRVFDAPRDDVFRVMNDPLYIPRWWGPRRLTTEIDRMEFHNGGFWRFVQHDADGNEYAFHGEYYEIIRPERVDRTFEYEGMPGKVLFESVSYEDQDGKTLVTEKSVFETVEDRDGMLATGAEEGSIESMDRIADILAEISPPEEACEEEETQIVP